IISFQNTASRERRRNRLRAPFGDEDIPIVFAGSGGRELFHRRLSASHGTGFLYDERMLLHKNEWFPSYPECPERSSMILSRCELYGLLSRCTLITAEPASDELLFPTHRHSYVSKVTETESMLDDERKTLASDLDSAYFNEHTNLAARLAVGSVIQAVESVHHGDVRNAFCLIRPPGHHAMDNEACGFCIFNNVAIAAQYALDRLEYNRILIVDWDVHHGQATQYAFYDSSRPPGHHAMDNEACGFCIFNNVAIAAQYALDRLEYNRILIVDWDLTGQLELSPPLFAHLTHKLMCLAEGKLVVALEGGYYLDSLAESAAHTISALLGDSAPSLEPIGEVHPSVLKSISYCVSVLRARWKSLHVYQIPDVMPFSEVHQLAEQSWLDTKVPVMAPEKHVHDPEDLQRIDDWLSYVKQAHPVAQHSQRASTCIVYDSRMENHKNEDDRNHPETPHRIRRCYELLDEYGLARRCKRVESRYATRAELLRVHTESYVNAVAKTAGLEQRTLNRLAQDEDSIYFNRHTYDCARLAAGSVLAVIEEICTGRCMNGVAVIRPPGHHALADRCMGFCFFNNVAIGARHAQQVYGLERIAIVDWDVHHGNGTQKIFEDDPNNPGWTPDVHGPCSRCDNQTENWVCLTCYSVYCSRYANSHMVEHFSTTRHPLVLSFSDLSSWCYECESYVHNERHVKDGEYIAVFMHLILPILYEFRPQLIIVSAGFDAVRGDRLGGLGVSPECFGHLTHLLLTTAYLCTPVDHASRRDSSSERTTRQRVAHQQQSEFTGGLLLVLEGGYHLAATAEAICHSVASLLGDCCPRLYLGLSPTEKGCKAVRRSLLIQEQYWKSISGYGPIRSQLRLDELLRLGASDQSRPGAQSALAFTSQLETEIQSRLEDLSLSDSASPRFSSPLNHYVPPTSTSFTLAVSDAVGIGSASVSLPTTSLATRVPAVPAAEQDTLPELGAELFTSASAGQVVSSSVTAPSSSSTTLQGALPLQQLTNEFTHLHVDSPYTGQSERSSLTSEATPILQSHQPTMANPAGSQLGGSSGPAVRNQVVAVATLQDLMNVTSIGTEDIHAFFGLVSLCTVSLHHLCTSYFSHLQIS
ncbi:hypothetical protein AHF37_04411, partial [Paragonimus kellicotti]